MPDKLQKTRPDLPRGQNLKVTDDRQNTNPFIRKTSVASANFTLFSLILFGCILSSQSIELDATTLHVSLRQEYLIAACTVYIVLYVVVTFFAWLSKDTFRIAGALVFGAGLSTLLVWASEMCNATILFRLSRRLGRDSVRRAIPVKSLLVERDSNLGFWGVFALRAAPLLPFRFLDLSAGLTNMPFFHYIAIAALASPARIFWMQSILAALGDAALTHPLLIQQYLLENPMVLIGSLLYLLASIVAIATLRKPRHRVDA